MNPTINDSLADIGRTIIQPDTQPAKYARASIKNPVPPALLLGDLSVCDPPDPISNSAVKPDCANGTNAQALEE